MVFNLGLVSILFTTARVGAGFPPLFIFHAFKPLKLSQSLNALECRNGTKESFRLKLINANAVLVKALSPI
jgi:hypothetical protein